MVISGKKMIKYLIVFFNLLFLLLGFVILGVGIKAEIQNEKYMGFFGNSFASPLVMLIVVGVIVTIIAFFGCCGAVKQNYCMMMTYSALLGVIMILELAAGISSFVLRADLNKVVYDNMITSLDHYNKSDSDQHTITKSWDLMQQDMSCCGVTSFKDWADKSYFSNTTNVPDSCCKVYSKGCGIDAYNNLKNIDVSGCLNTLLAFAEENVLVVGGVGIGIAFVQVIGIVFACCFAKSIKAEYEEVA